MSEYQPRYEKSYALVIGINTYSDPRFVPLGNAEDDAQEVADLLVAPPFEFEVQTLLGEGATRDAILDALYGLRDTEPDDRVLIYFAGHGYTLTSRRGHETGYLACVDTLPEKYFTALKLDTVTELRDYAGAKHIAFIFDACFSGQALGLTRAPSVAADKLLERRAYQVISAGAGDQTVSDFRSMTCLFLDELRASVSGGTLLTLNELGLRIQQAMTASSKSKQIPQFGHLTDSQGGDFVFCTPPEVRPIDLLPDRLRRGLTSQDADTRFLALDRAEKLLPDPRYDSALREVLREIALNDPDHEVRGQAMDLLLEAERVQTPEPVIEVIEPEPEPEPSLHKEFEPEMVAVPAGEFLMGSDRSVDEMAYDNEPEQLCLHLPDYAVGKYPVTVGQYRYFVEAGGYRERRYWTDAGWHWKEREGRTEPDYWNDNEWAGDNRLPVVFVTWYEAYAYCRWLAEATGHDYRLPTEAEWEKAARGTDGCIYPWGNEYIVGYANVDESGFDGGRYLERTSPVGAYPKGISPYGAHDMSGNVWEWCLSKWSKVYAHPEDNDPEGDAPRVLHSGSWYDHPALARAAYRLWYNPDASRGHWGFRVVGVSSLSSSAL